MNSIEKKKELIINVLYIAVICGLVYLSVNYLLGLLFPFIMGFLFAYAAVKVCRRFFKNDRKLHRGITLTLIYLLIILAAVLIVSLGISKIGDFIEGLPSFYKNTMEPYISSLEEAISGAAYQLPWNIRELLNNFTDGIFDSIKSILSSAVSGIAKVTTSVITNVPQTLLSILVAVTTSFYMVFDYENISEWFTSSLSEKALGIFNEIKDFFENVLLKIFGSYATIMGITFVELFIGLTIFRISNGGMWAMLIALLDILPVLGVGTVLIPWGVSCLITGKFLLGIELLVLYTVITLIRNIIEPRMVGISLNLHPLATLISMIVGVRMFGAVGMFGFPLALSFFHTRKKKQAE
ncbi:MAG: AI-2E family transporter [Erysipelotrichaceae bacterium]|nr:AI-2E family transporter [Erysipelotrichaceae bacterium]